MYSDAIKGETDVSLKTFTYDSSPNVTMADQMREVKFLSETSVCLYKIKPFSTNLLVKKKITIKVNLKYAGKTETALLMTRNTIQKLNLIRSTHLMAMCLQTKHFTKHRKTETH